MDGFDLCRAIRASDTNRELPIILLMSGPLSLERPRACPQEQISCYIGRW